MSVQHAIPVACFKEVIIKADKIQDYELYLGTSLCFYDEKENALISPVHSECLYFKYIDQVSFNPEAGTYLIKYINKDNKTIKRIFSIKKKVIDEVIKTITLVKTDVSFLRNLILVNTNKNILFDNKLVSYSAKRDCLLYKDSRKVIKLKDIKEIKYKPFTNILEVLYKEEYHPVLFVMNYTGIVLGDIL